MGAVWFVAEDIKYYTEAEKLENVFSEFGQIILFPNADDIKENFSDNNIAFLSNKNPPDEYLNIFVVKELENTQGILTSQEVANNISEEESIELKLGLKTTKDNLLTFNDLGGAENFKDYCKRIIRLKEEENEIIKSILLVGMPGTGKSFGVACFAGEFKYNLTYLNLQIIMESSNPIKTLNNSFLYLEKHNVKTVLLIDEMEQMVNNTALLGALLTLLNDLNTPQGYKLNGFLFATANNVHEVSAIAPQFLRAGRWEGKFFVNYPKKYDAINIMQRYRDKFKIEYANNSLIEILYIKINEYYKKYNIDENLCVLSSAEIEQLFKNLKYYTSFSEINLDILIEDINPLQKTNQIALHKLWQDAKRNGFKQL